MRLILAFISAMLIFQNTMAQSGKQFGKPRLLVDHVFVIDPIQNQYPEIRKNMMQAFYQSERIALIPPAQIAQYYQNQSRSKPTESHLDRARDLLNQGVEAYQQIEYEKAQKLLQSSRDEWIRNLAHLRSNRDLLKAHLYLGMTHIALSRLQDPESNLQKAKQEFQKVVYLDTQLVLSTRSYSPEVIAAYEEVKQQLLSRERVVLRASSNLANSNIYINGKLEGKAPLTLRLLPGTYYVLVESSVINSKPWTKLVQLERPVEEVQALVEPDMDLASEQRLFQIREGSLQSDNTDLQTRAKALSADMIFLSNIEQLDGYRLLGQLYDARTDEFSQVAFIQMGRDLHDLEGSSYDLAQALLSQIRADGYLIGSTKANLADSQHKGSFVGQQQEQGIQKVEKPPTQLYKKWWFWAGVVAVGAGGYFAYDNFAGGSSGGIQINNAGNF